MDYVFESHGLCKTYKGKVVVNNVNMHVRKGDIYGFVGKNGAGKTTIMRLICGLIRPTSGNLSLFGTPLGVGYEKAVKRMAAMVETPSMYPNMNALENLRAQFYIRSLPYSEEKAKAILKEVDLADTGNKIALNFSLGMRQRLAIAMLLVGDPELLLLDEPTNGLDPEGIADVRNLLQSLNRERGVTVLVSSHILSELSKLATCYGFIDNGNLFKEIASADIEHECGSAILFEVDNPIATKAALDNAGIVYRFKDTLFEARNETIMGIMKMCAAVGVEVLHIKEREVDLESYFLSMLRG